MKCVYFGHFVSEIVCILWRSVDPAAARSRVWTAAGTQSQTVGAAWERYENCRAWGPAASSAQWLLTSITCDSRQLALPCDSIVAILRQLTSGGFWPGDLGHLTRKTRPRYDL